MNKIHVHPRKSELLGGALLVLLRLAVRLLARDWRGGGLTIVLVSLVLAVATVTSISLFNSRIHNSIHADAAQFMASDVSVKGSHSIPVTWAEKAQRLGFRTASSIGFASMLCSENNMALAEVKAVSEQYPLLGTLELSEVVFGGGAGLFGAIVSAFSIAQAQSILEFFISGSMAKVYTLLALDIILMFKPEGLFASKVRR